ncbi:hypothetical protein Neosp_008224 [[Neocosmospora] mangrovei]
MPRVPRHSLNWGTILADVAAVTSPIAFLVFTIMVLCLDGSEVSETSFAKWNNATTVLGTLFPIIFASTVGRFVYEVARWKLEQGVTLGTLEQLLGSQTVGSTVLTHAKLCIMNPLGVGLLFIWIFSPLGGQSLLRILGSNLESVVQNSTVVHFDPDAVSILAWYKPPSGSAAAIIDDTLRYLENWYRYPVANVPMGNSTFSMHTSYLQLNCSKQQRAMWKSGYNLTELESWVEVPVTYQNGTVYGVPRENNGNFSSQVMTTWNFGVDRFVDPFWLNDSHLPDRLGWGLPHPYTPTFTRPLIFENETGIESKPANLFFEAVIEPAGSPAQIWTYTVAAKCEIKQRYVESRVSCSRTSRQNCTVVEQRPSRRRHAPENISHLSFPTVSRFVSRGLPLAGGVSSSGRPDLSMKYLAHPKSGHIISTIYEKDFEKLSDELFSRRLSQLLNTYIILSQTDMEEQRSTEGVQLISENVTEPAQVSNLVRTYTISKPWITLCFVSCIVLLSSGVLSVVFAHLADSPEILGYASTAVRDSRFLELLPEVGSMAAMDITKMMRGERLRYGITHLTRKGQRLLGVGREVETEQIKDRFD